MSRMRANLYRDPPAPAPPLEPGWLVGLDEAGGKLLVPYNQLYQTHAWVLGATGWGKSCALFSIACQTILDGHGLVCIDPDGSLADMLVNFIVTQGIPPERVVLIDMRNPDWRPKLNPLESWDGQLGTGTNIASGALLLAAGDENFVGMPRLRKYVRASCLSLEKQGLPLSLLPWFLSFVQEGRELRLRTTRETDNRYHQLVWENLAELGRHDQTEHLDSTMNRVTAYAEDPRMLELMTSRSQNLNWKRELDKQSIVICNLGQDGPNPLQRDDLRLLGGLLVHGIVQAAYQRPIGQGRHTFVLCDEFPEYLSNDLASGLARLRKREVHFVLAHQYLDQIEQDNPKLMASVETNCQVKLIFGGLRRLDAERLAKELYTGEVHGDEIKRATAQVAFRPVMKWMDIQSQSHGGFSATGRSTTEGRSVSDGTSASEGETTTSTTSNGMGSSTAVLYVPEEGIVFNSPGGETVTTSFSEAASQSRAWSRATTSSHSETNSYAESVSSSEGKNWSIGRTRLPITTHQEFLQPEQYERYTLEEQWEKRIAQLMNLPKRCLAVKMPGRAARIVQTLPIEERLCRPEDLRRFVVRVFELSPYVDKTEVARKTFDQVLTESGFGNDPVVEPDDFDVAEAVVDIAPAEPPKPSGKDPVTDKDTTASVEPPTNFNIAGVPESLSELETVPRRGPNKKRKKR